LPTYQSKFNQTEAGLEQDPAAIRSRMVQRALWAPDRAIGKPFLSRNHQFLEIESEILADRGSRPSDQQPKSGSDEKPI
jgi:hypothetical protein